MPRNNELQNKIRELQLRRLRSQQAVLAKGNAEVPNKKKSKPLGYKMQNTFEKSLKSVPGGSMSRGVTAAVIKMVAAPNTGTKLGPEIGILRSARNANTTSGQQNRSIVRDETGKIVSDRQGRMEFGR